MQIRPFKALRPADAATAARVACLPYDVVDAAEARAAAAADPDSFMHVVRSEADLPQDADPRAPAVYEKAREALQGLVARGVLVREAGPSVYLYRQTMQGRSQTAVVACCAAADYGNGTILKHEKTRKDKEDDRTDHILATRAHTGQVFLCHEDVPAIDALVAAETENSAPLCDFSAADGVGHAVWRVRDPDAFVRAYEAVPRAYIADGHHRSAASFRAAEKLAREAAAAGAKPEETAQAESSWFMACLFPASQLRILPYNRCVRDLAGLSEREFLKAALARGFSAASIPAPDAALPSHSCALRLPGGWYRLTWPVTDAQAADPVARLDPTRLQEDLLAPVLGIGDPRTDPRIFFVGGMRGTAALEDAVASGRAAAAFAMAPATISQMMSVADAGLQMPPKSTWFEPKLRSGLLVHEF
ncbi:MAG: DUF1015 domain-containing protein [Kiritimatiellae bacterium]|nr:DUF1015 domain-containing protein [Kiritimatiellia bacterium]